jgi:hypothetical protein
MGRAGTRLPSQCSVSGGRRGGERTGNSESAFTYSRHLAYDDRQLARCIPDRGAGGARAQARRAASRWAGVVRTRNEARSGDGASRGASGVRDASHPGRAGAFRGAGRERVGGAAHPARGGLDSSDAAADRGTDASGTALRAGGAESALAVGHLHVSAPTPSARVRDGFHGRPLTLHRFARDGAPPALRARDGGARAWHREVRDASGDSDGQRAAVRGMAR